MQCPLAVKRSTANRDCEQEPAPVTTPSPSSSRTKSQFIREPTTPEGGHRFPFESAHGRLPTAGARSTQCHCGISLSLPPWGSKRATARFIPMAAAKEKNPMTGKMRLAPSPVRKNDRRTLHPSGGLPWVGSYVENKPTVCKQRWQFLLKNDRRARNTENKPLCSTSQLSKAGYKWVTHTHHSPVSQGSTEHREQASMLDEPTRPQAQEVSPG